MHIYHKCPSCKESVSIRSSAPTPQELEHDKGEHFSLTCDKCSTTFQAEAMQTRAKESPFKLGMAAGLSLVLGFLLWNMGLIGTLSAAPIVIIYFTESSSVTTYNRLSKRKWG